MIRRILGLMTLACATPLSAQSVTLVPVEDEQQEIRYDAGSPTILQRGNSVDVAIMPLDRLSGGGFQFKVLVSNRKSPPAHFGVENISLQRGDRLVQSVTFREMRERAKDDALLAQIGLGILTGGLSAAQGNTILTGRRGGGPSFGQVATISAGVGGIIAVQMNMHQKIARLRANYIQTTTVDRGSDFGGLVVMHRARARRGETVHLNIDFAGEEFAFSFVVDR